MAASSIFPQRLKKLRIEKGMTQTELGGKVGVKQNTFTNWENGKREPSFQKLFLLAEHLETNTDYLLGKSDNPKNSSTHDNDKDFSANYMKQFLYMIYGEQKTLEEFSASSEGELLDKIKSKMQEFEQDTTSLSELMKRKRTGNTLETTQSK